MPILDATKSEASTAATVKASSSKTPKDQNMSHSTTTQTQNTTQVTGGVAPFNFGNHAVRVVMQEGTVWFVATDVCAALGYQNTSKAVGDHLDDDERQSALVSTPNAPLGVPTNVINESGLYALVLRSRKPEARKFAKWVTSEVLPSIRKTGTYTQPTTLTPAQKQNLHELVDIVVSSGKQTHGEIKNIGYTPTIAPKRAVGLGSSNGAVMNRLAFESLGGFFTSDAPLRRPGWENRKVRRCSIGLPIPFRASTLLAGGWK